MTSQRGVKFARWTYVAAAIYGILVLAPQYFMEQQIGRDYPPPITHPEQFYGFIGLALAWQFAFLIIARDPIRYRPFMLVTVLEKLAFGIPAVILYLQNRLSPVILVPGIIDLVLAVFFLLAYRASHEKR
jgi:hypothetical protein